MMFKAVKMAQHVNTFLRLFGKTQQLNNSTLCVL